MARNREKNREKVKESKKEERLDSKTAWGIKDPTPQAAVQNIINESRGIRYVY